MSRQTNIQIRRGSASDWSSVNPTLAAGEVAVEQDTFKIKVGDGSTAWNNLKYIGADGGSLDEGAGTTTTAVPGATTTAAPTTTTAAPTTTTAAPTTTTAAPTTTTAAPTTTTTTTAAPVQGLAITSQPKNNYEGAFSVTAVGVGNLSYQWQEFSPGNPVWENISSDNNTYGATTANLTMNLGRYGGPFSGVTLRVIVTDDNDASTVTSQEVHLVDYSSLNAFYELTSYSTSGTTTVNGIAFQNVTATSEELSDYGPGFYGYISYGDWDSSWYTGDAVTLKVQRSTDATNWTDEIVLNGNPYIDNYSEATAQTGVVYYRTLSIKKWPLTATDGTQSAPVSSVETLHNFYKVTWS